MAPNASHITMALSLPAENTTAAVEPGGREDSREVPTSDDRAIDIERPKWPGSEGFASCNTCPNAGDSFIAVACTVRYVIIAGDANTTQSITCVWAWGFSSLKSMRGSEWSVVQRITLWSPPADTNSFRSSPLATSTLLTHSLWPIKVRRQNPVTTSHSRIVLSREADNKPSVPVGVKAKRTADTAASWPCNVFAHDIFEKSPCTLR